MIYKQKDNRVSTNVHQEVWNASGSQTHNVYHSTSNAIGQFESILEVENVERYVPGVYRENPVQIRQGLMVSSPSSCDITIPGWGRERVSGDVACHDLVQRWGTPSYPAVTWRTSREDGALWSIPAAGFCLQKAAAKLGEAEKDFGLFLAEFRETVQMLRNPFSAFSVLAKDMKKTVSSLKRVLSWSEIPASLWLQYRYGIMPLINDIQMIISDCEDLLCFTDKSLFKKKGTVETEETHEYTDLNAMFNPLFNGASKYRTRVTVKEKYVATLTYNLTAEFNDYYRLARWGLHPSMFVPCMYELLTLSFVLDWFLGVGNWLRTIMPKPGVKVLGNSVTRVRRTTIEHFHTTFGYSDSVTETVPKTLGVATLQVDAMQRTTQEQMPVLPSLNPTHLGTLRELDSLALIWGKILPLLLSLLKR